MRNQNFIQATLGVGLFLVMSFAVVGGAQVLKLCNELRQEIESVGAIKPEALELTTEVYDRRGEKIGELAGERRYYVAVQKLPKHVSEAFLSAEDKGFYEHFGVSPKAIVRSFIANLKGGRIKQGGSTITQQLARLYFLAQEKTLARKLKEAVLAVAMERRFSKEEILELYLNKIYLGNRSYGIEAASRNYFRKHSWDLSIGEAALLAALPKSPNYYAPHRHPEHASKRQRFVLQRMADDGFITETEAAEWAKKVIPVAKTAEDHWSTAPYVIVAVQEEMARKFEFDQLPREGLKIFTTLDARLQHAAADSLKMALRNARRHAIDPFKVKGSIEGAIFSMDPKTGAVLAMQGGGDFAASQFNRAVSTKRRLGGLFMPVFMSLALERGYDLDASLGSDPMAGKKKGGEAMLPSLREALLGGRVLEAARLYTSLGSGSVLEHAKKLGLELDREDLMVALGYGEASPAQITAAYSAFANGGKLVEPYLVARVEDARGKLLYQAPPPEGGEAMRLETAQAMRKLMRENIRVGSADLARGVDALAGGVSAATDDLHNAWFAGVSSRLVSCVWLGAESGRVRLAESEPLVANAAERLWHDFMRLAPQVYLEARPASALSQRNQRRER